MTDHERLPNPTTRTEGEGETLDMPEGLGSFITGQVLGERYQILEMLGRGGMGEVWHAFDLKLRVEVALKALREDLFKSERRLELLRQEVRAAREVVSPNVCRIFDLIEVEERELVSMEYVDGATLLGVLQERGPLELKEAQDIASQFLAGLEAIHKVGLIHRDIKPENIMLTRAGRVVVMDFGLARQDTEGGGSVSGTPAYMAPEQAAGQTVDARADVYAAGVVLAEMVSPDGIKSYESRQSLWEGVRSEPAKLPDSPWAPAIKKAVAKDRERRYHTAHTLTRALEDVTLRVEGAEDLHPYPGLASFTEDDAEYFFGREAEVEQMWRKLDRPHLLALVGPSGAGKTSFLQAGLAPSAGPGWEILRCTPGSTPFTSLGQALAREMAGDVKAVELLARGHEPDALVGVVGRWRKRHDHALLIIDQFEELFTHGSADEQRNFSELLARLALEADVFVLLSMRDDFLIRCREYESLGPVFTDLTALLAPTGAALRRAMVQPATKCGYRFEDDDLVEEMLAEVEGERGALPLLAFALARLWKKRDRDTGLLTRQAYQDIGGVGGALARHAESTIDNIGNEHIGIVRELFRNLVTADGTRAVREWDELLSIFSESQSESPAAVLRALIDARLLTSYEVKEEDSAPTRRVEIIHESLLANWPRLVRWQTQDADSAQLRDQLRQAARTWEERGRSDDMLWTGSSYLDYLAWRERYPGGLTKIEDAFTTAMTAAARRHRQRRRIAVASALVLAGVVAAVFGILWRNSVLETRRAEASKLLTVAQLQLDTDPTEALAYATASLELADTEEARVFSMRALWTAPPVLALDLLMTNPQGSFPIPTFSPDGRWLAAAGLVSEQVLVWNERGGNPVDLGGHAVSGKNPIRCSWTRDGLLATGHWTEGRARIWALPDGRLVREVDFGGKSRWQVGDTHLFAATEEPEAIGIQREYRLRSWKLPDGDSVELGTVPRFTQDAGARLDTFDPNGMAWVHVAGKSVISRSLPIREVVPGTIIARHSSDGVRLDDWRRSEGIYSNDSAGNVVMWTSADGTADPGKQLRKPGTADSRLQPDSRGRWVVGADWSTGQDGKELLWDLEGFVGARPIELRRRGSWYLSYSDFHPSADWVVASTNRMRELTFWPLTKAFPAVVDGYDTFSRRSVAFTPDGRYLVTNWGQDRVRLWPLPGSEIGELVELMLPEKSNTRMHLAVSPTSEKVLTLGYGNEIFVLSTDGADPRQLNGFPANDVLERGAFSPSGLLVATAGVISESRPTLRVWNLETGEERVFDLPEKPENPDGKGYYDGFYVSFLGFFDETTLYTSGGNGLLRWNLEKGSYQEVIESPPGKYVFMCMSSDRRKMLTFVATDPSSRGLIDLHDLTTGHVRRLHVPGQSTRVGLGPKGEIWITGEEDGLIWVGRTDGGEAHVLPGHVGPVTGFAISPDRKWIASSGEDKTLRLWPMPDLSKPPLHTLPHDELIVKLKTLTNLRVIRDEESPGGWKVEIGPFPGWAEVPEW